VEKRNRIVREVINLLNVPFCINGRTKFGIDCIGLIYLSYHKALNVVFPKFDGRSYKGNWWQFTKEERLLNFLLKYCDFTDSPLPGDIITFRLFGKDNPINHCGIYIDNNTFVHAKTKNPSKVCKESMFSSIGKRKFKFLVYKGLI